LELFHGVADVVRRHQTFSAISQFGRPAVLSNRRSRRAAPIKSRQRDTDCVTRRWEPSLVLAGRACLVDRQERCSAPGSASCWAIRRQVDPAAAAEPQLALIQACRGVYRARTGAPVLEAMLSSDINKVAGVRCLRLERARACSADVAKIETTTTAVRRFLVKVCGPRTRPYSLNFAFAAASMLVRSCAAALRFENHNGLVIEGVIRQQQQRAGSCLSLMRVRGPIRDSPAVGENHLRRITEHPPGRCPLHPTRATGAAGKTGRRA
jgi:hypothetical protein